MHCVCVCVRCMYICTHHFIQVCSMLCMCIMSEDAELTGLNISVANASLWLLMEVCQSSVTHTVHMHPPCPLSPKKPTSTGVLPPWKEEFQNSNNYIVFDQISMIIFTSIFIFEMWPRWIWSTLHLLASQVRRQLPYPIQVCDARSHAIHVSSAKCC